MPGSCPLECQEPGSAVGYLAVDVDLILVSIPTWSRCLPGVHYIPEICSISTSKAFSWSLFPWKVNFLVVAINVDLRKIGNLTYTDCSSAEKH